MLGVDVVVERGRCCSPVDGGQANQEVNVVET